ncbi:hypothetical protein EBF04_23815 [Streptomyces sp. I6]|nr:hypothetical protein EBF04_23815 [Streptomyces sp. I6]
MLRSRPDIRAPSTARLLTRSAHFTRPGPGASGPARPGRRPAPVRDCPPHPPPAPPAPSEPPAPYSPRAPPPWPGPLSAQDVGEVPRLPGGEETRRRGGEAVRRRGG